ncbi:MAG: RusA family crossover junction endodeoxyribonuclease [Planctomycetota bacterium]|jgi:Holliday junction resolvase RusA-like endonuclease|nr:RusA family crossover junction endodeoxyribonuclease [Planctomycetota bacterium]
MRITFIVPGIPAGKARPRFARIGRHVRAYQPAADARRESLVALAYRQAAGALPPHAGPATVAVEAVFTPPRSWPRKRRENPGFMLSKPDGDNIPKLILDVLNGVAYTDDSHVVRKEVSKRYGERDETRVTVEFLDAGEGHFPARGATLAIAAGEREDRRRGLNAF